MSKPFRDTAVGKFLQSKGFNSVLNVAGAAIPGVKILQDVKNAVMGSQEFKDLTPEEREQFLRLYDLEVQELDKRLADVQNARFREIEIKKLGKSDWFMNTAGIIALAAFIFIIYVLVFRNIPEANKTLFTHLIGIIEGVVISIYAYYWGSSKGSRDKTQKLFDEKN